MIAPEHLPGQVVIIDYTNWRGERSKRRIIPNIESLWFGFNDWHKEAQWLLDAYDVEKGDIRTFAMKDIHSWTPALCVSDESRNGQDPKGLEGEAPPARCHEVADAPSFPSLRSKQEEKSA